MHIVCATVASAHQSIISLKHDPRCKAGVVLSVFLSSKRAVDESEVEAAERRSLRCVWVSGGRALTEQEAAVEIVSEARLLLQEDLAQLGVQWDPATLPPEAPAVNSPDDHHSGDSDTSSASCLSSHGAQVDIKGQQAGDGVKKSESRDTDRHGKENKEECKGEKRMPERKIEKAEGETKSEQGKSEHEGNVLNKKLEEHRKEVRTEPEIRQICSEVQVERSKETKKDETNTKLLMGNDTEDPDEKREGQKHTRSKQGGEECKTAEPKEGILPNRPVPERSLTQELAEIVSSPLPQPMPRPQPSPSPMPPPRFRAPIARAEEQHSVGTTGLAASPVQPGRLKHSRALSKVLHSIQTDKILQNNVETEQTSLSKPAVFSSVQNSAPAGQVPRTIQAPGPVAVSTPTNADADSPLSVSPASVPLFSPEAKRRRTDGGEVDKFSSPELYAGDEREVEVEGNVKKGEESFGDSFELDTQTERIIVQQRCQHGDGSDRGMNQPVETKKIREEEMVEAAVEHTNEGRLEAPDNACPRFNISLTDSQMELILNTSHQVSDLNHPLCSDYKHQTYSDSLALKNLKL